jgi:Ca2+/Na+ antiporter
MFFFDCLYYRIAKFYASYHEKGAESSSSGIVGGFMTLNVMTIVMLYMVVFEPKPYFDKLIVIVLFVIFQIYAYVRYSYKDNHSVDLIEQKWLSKSESYRRQFSILLFLYGAISIVLFIGLAIYLGSRNQSS